MKKLLMIVLAMVCVFAHASEVDSFYQPKYEIVSVEPMCPPSLPGGVSCYGIGVVVKLKSVLRGCLDEVVFFNSQEEKIDEDVVLHVAALAKFPAANGRVRCVKPAESVKTVVLPFMNVESVSLEQEAF